MALQPNKKNKVELQAAPSRGTRRYPVLATLALAALTTPCFAQNGTGDRGPPPNRRLQSGPVPSAPAQPSVKHSPITPGNHGAASITGGATQPRSGSQPPLRIPPAAQGATLRPPLHGTASYSSPGQHGAHAPPNDGVSSYHATSMSRTTGGTRVEHQFSSGHRVLETTRAMPGSGTLHAVRYGRSVTGVVEHPMKSGYWSRTYVQGGRVLYARVYRQNTFQRFGRAYSYQSLIPAVAFGAAYYTWAARPWTTPVSYQWQWERQPWHAAYGSSFTPYSSYTSLDEWLTDYVIAQNLRNSYETWQAETAPESGPVVAGAAPAANENPARADGKRPYWESSDAGQRPYWESPDADSRPYWEESSGDDTHAQPKRAKKPDSRSGLKSGPPAEHSPPPLSGDIKAEINAQIKQRLVERQTPATTSDTDTLPDSLKPGHVLFRVNAPLDVPSDASGRLCSLDADDYIERTGEMDENGMVPVKVKLGSIADCGTGLTTRVSVNDLEAMESDQQQALTDAMLAASRHMGGSGLPQAPGTTPMLLAAGQTRPAPDATTTLSQLQ